MNAKLRIRTIENITVGEGSTKFSSGGHLPLLRKSNESVEVILLAALSRPTAAWEGG